MSTQLKDALNKYDKNTSIKGLIDGLQNGVYFYGVPTPDKSVFQSYLISLLNSKSAEELKNSVTALQLQLPQVEIGLKVNLSKNTDKLSESLDGLKDEIKLFSKASTKASKTLVVWTVILAISTVVLAVATVALVFITK